MGTVSAWLLESMLAGDHTFGEQQWGGRKPGSATIDYSRAEELRRKGLSVGEISQALGCSKSSLYGALRDRGLVRNYSR